VGKQYNINLRNKNIEFINPYVCGRQQCSAGYSHKGIRRYWLIHYVVSGKGTLTVDGKKYEVRQGEAFIIFPDEFFEYRADEKEPWYYQWVGFSGTYASYLEKNQDRVLKVPGHIFEEMQMSEKYGDMCEEYIASKVMELLCDMFGAEKKKSYAEIAKNIVDSDYMKRISVQSVAMQIGIDKNYLTKVFKKQYGINLQKYIIEKRMKEARYFLNNGYSVGEVSMLVGYLDSFSFSRAYKNVCGVPPKEEKNSLNNQH